MSRSEEFVNGTYLHNTGGNDFSIFHGTGENAVGTQSGAFLRVEAPTGHYRGWDELAHRAERRGYEPEDTEEAFPSVRDANDNRIYERNSEGDRQAVRQGVLFEDTRTPPKVDLMIATKDARHHVPAMLEAANKKSQELYGQNVQHSDNLSEHSLPLVNRLIRAGLSSGPEIQGSSNNFDFRQAHSRIQEAADEKNRYWDSGDTTEIDRNTFQQGGRDFIKRLSAAEKARGIRKTPSSRLGSALSGATDRAKSRVDNFRQDFLPGMNLSPSQLQNKTRGEDD
jgi:hypothetical protein